MDPHRRVSPVRLADVLVPLRAPAALLAVAAVLKAVDFTVRWSTAVAILWVLAAVVCACSERAGAAAVAILAWWTALATPYYQNHIAWLAWLALTFVIFRDRGQQRFIVRWQLSILYGFAAAVKLHSDWLSGAILESRGLAIPFGLAQPAALATVVVEAWLAVAIWRPRWRWPAIGAAVVTHSAFVAGGGASSFARTGLLVFAITCVGFIAWSTTPARVAERQAGPRTGQAGASA